MLERLTLLSIQAHLLADGSWFGITWKNLSEAYSEKRYFDIMLNPYVIAFSVLLLLISILGKSKKPLMVLIASWGYCTVYHFTIEGRGKGDVMFDFRSMQVSEIGPLVWFFVGFILVTGLLLYIVFVRGD